ncbi:SufE family protein [Vibrio fluminensis]|uniref:SufE family protein n=1 Tax=Vibrio fluminensis TaxID=2783614 RepID=UPI0018881A1A|nr:SufE family protein [Vibrio fluminensis]
MTTEKILRNFNRCVNWEERYLYLMELGERLKPFPSDKMNERFLVRGCQSQVWLEQYYDNQELVIVATSDTGLVRGLIALVTIAYEGKTPKQVLEFGITDWFRQLELDSHLTASRTQGLEAIVASVVKLASSELAGAKQ